MNIDEVRRQADRQGRNTRCLCGSGKKYKHCHLLSAIRSNSDPRLEIAMHAMLGLPCILCDKLSDAAGLFVPTAKWKRENPRPNGAERSPGNTLVYPICSTCIKKSQGTDEVEKRLEEQSRAGRLLHDDGEATP